MKLSTALSIVVATHSSANNLATAQECVLGAFTLEFEGTCDFSTILEEYTRQVFDATGNVDAAACGSMSAEDDLKAKLELAGTSAEELCLSALNDRDVTPYHKAARQGTDYQFEQHFYNGRSHFQEEVETLYESADGSATAVLKEDAKYVREMYEGDGKYGVMEWPNMLTNFDDSTCTMNTAMCCWPKDRQANDNNGNCAKAYDVNCIDKDPADNTDLCYMNMENGKKSNEFAKEDGFMVFPGDNNDGEGAIHCHGFAWGNDENDSITRYKANNLFYVSMYDHMYVRGYVKEIPGAPMCACLEQMPVVSRSDCTQVDLEEQFKMMFDGDKFELVMTKSEITFNACQGINNRNNDLWAYAARLYEEGRITNEQFGKVGRIITDSGCDEAVQYELNKIGLTRGYEYDTTVWTKVAGRDSLYESHPFGREAFNSAFFEHSSTAPTDLAAADGFDSTPIIKRVCATCVKTHQHIYYRRLTPVNNTEFDLLNHLMYQRDNGGGENVWGEDEDFTMHSTYEDAISGANAWACPGGVYNYGAGFPGECSPDGTRVTSQTSIWNWSSKSDVAYFVNKPVNEGVKEIDPKLRTGSFTDLDIGEVGLPGRTMETEDGTLHISASGNDVWSKSDQFRYFSQPMSGDIQVDVHVSSFTNIVNSWAKSGIMIRSSNEVNAEYAFATFTGASGLSFQFRKSKGGDSSSAGSTDYDTADGSVWLRLVKKMGVIEMWKSADADSWVFHASTELLFPNDSYQIGLAVCSHDSYRASEATFENYDISTYAFPTSAPSISQAPTAWTPSIDIGDVQREGQYIPANPDTGIITVKGSGTGTWGTQDSFFFHSEQRDADNLDIICYVNNWGWNWNYSKGGIMIRDGKTPDAAHTFLAITGRGQGVAFQSRGESGAVTDHHSYNWVPSNNVWLKLSKSGSTITAYFKHTSETEWTSAGETELHFSSIGFAVGLAVTAGDEYKYALSQLDVKDFSIEDGDVATIQ